MNKDFFYDGESYSFWSIVVYDEEDCCISTCSFDDGLEAVHEFNRLAAKYNSNFEIVLYSNDVKSITKRKGVKK